MMCEISSQSEKIIILKNMIINLREKLQNANHFPDSLIFVALWTIAEFCTLQAFDKDLISDISDVICKDNISHIIQLCGLTALIKLRAKIYNEDNQIKDEIENTFRYFNQYEDEEIQKRACEYLSMSKNISEIKLHLIFDQMPSLIKNSIQYRTTSLVIAPSDEKKITSITSADQSEIKILDLFSTPSIGQHSNLENTNPINFPLFGNRVIGVGSQTLNLLDFSKNTSNVNELFPINNNNFMNLNNNLNNNLNMMNLNNINNIPNMINQQPTNQQLTLNFDPFTL